jgi:penicillin-binding protein 1C
MKRLPAFWFFLFSRHKKATLAVLGLLFIGYWFCLPDPLFEDPTCMVLEAHDGSLLGARIARDGQWRFPFSDETPEKFKTAIIEFEDKRFYRHPGFDPLAFGRAVWKNLVRRKIVSGGSTLSMQVIRLARKGKPRTVFEKLVEIVLATRLEIRFSKKNILAYYASNAPFGGNVVGLDAASWRYFGKSPANLSWSEAATLAVLPNSPALIHPGKNRGILLQKRNRLLKSLYENGKIDNLTFELALEEPIPDKPHPLPRLAPHLLERAHTEQFAGKKNALTRLRTTIDPALQAKLSSIALRRSQILKSNEIHNLAILVLEVNTGNVLAYIGNAPEAGMENGQEVDIIKAPRSTGSLLKPLLYALTMQDGSLTPNSLLPDVPTSLAGFKPENFMETYDGVVPAKRALSRSLNVPFVKMLQWYGVERFHKQLAKLGMTTVTRPAENYGLTLILGGAEGTLWEMTNIYACMARTLNHFYPNNGKYEAADFRLANYIWKEPEASKPEKKLLDNPPVLAADAIWFAFEAMNELERPTTQGDWERFESSRRIAWKTGTSFGFRDAWAIGVTPGYAVGIWIGNADGEGRPGLIGVHAAAPLFFEVFDQLPAEKWFDPPFDEMKKTVVCKQSGYLAQEVCEKDTVWAPQHALNGNACPYHRVLHLDQSKKWQVNSQCEAPSAMITQPWFVLPPLEEFYFKQRNPNYLPPPPFRKDCEGMIASSEQPMQLIYPKNPTKIYIPVELDGQPGQVVFKVAHRNPETTVYWNIGNQYLGATKGFHEFAWRPPAGKQVLTVVDENGNRLEQPFEVLVREKRLGNL